MPLTKQIAGNNSCNVNSNSNSNSNHTSCALFPTLLAPKSNGMPFNFVENGVPLGDSQIPQVNFTLTGPSARRRLTNSSLGNLPKRNQSNARFVITQLNVKLQLEVKSQLIVIVIVIVIVVAVAVVVVVVVASSSCSLEHPKMCPHVHVSMCPCWSLGVEPLHKFFTSSVAKAIIVILLFSLFSKSRFQTL